VTGFFDTSVLVAAFVEGHAHHTRSFEILAGSTKETAFCSAHTLAEAYAVLTRLPVKPRIEPEHAMLFLQEVRSRITIVSLGEADYFTTLEALAERSVGGGLIYDALLMRCASNSGADVIYTWNTKHFQRVAPQLADRIRTP
jgi:predicted nucleic acid-binding protein